MSTAVHVLGKDLRRFRGWLALWLVLVALPLVVLVLSSEVSVLVMFNRAMLKTGVAFATFFLFAVLIVLVVHEDPTTGSTAFWLTRPISATSLWGAKVLFVALVLVLPVAAVETAELALEGVPPRLVALALPEILLDWSAWAIWLLVLATVTSSLAGMIPALLGRAGLGWVAGLLVAAGTVLVRRGSLPDFATLGFFGAVRAAVWAGLPDTETLLPGADASRTLVLWTLGIACALGITRFQYGARRRGETWALLGASFVLLAIVQTFWRWDLVGGPPAATSLPPGSTLAQNVRVRIDPHAVRDTGTIERTTERSKTGNVRVRMIIDGVEPPDGAAVRTLWGTLTFPDGHTTSVQAEGAVDYLGGWDPRAVQALLGSARLVNLVQEDAVDGANPTITVPTEDLSRYRGASTRLAGNATVSIRAYHIAAELPLQPGAAYRTDLQQAAIDSVFCKDGDCSVMLRDTRVSLLLAPAGNELHHVMFFRFSSDVLYILRNRARGEAFWPQNGMTLGFGWIAHSRREETTMMGHFRSTGVPGQLPRLDDDWIAGADLVRIEATPVTEVTTQVDVPAFVIDAAPARPTT